MSNAPSVKIVIPQTEGAGTGIGTKVIINGIEFTDLKRISHGTVTVADDVVVSTLELTFYGDILVERSGS